MDLAPLYSALVAAQSDLVDVQRDSENPHFKSSYTSLDAVLREIRPVLNRHGLAILQLTAPCDRPDHLRLITRLAHVSGAHIESVTEIPLGRKSDPQSWGSALTYARRYGALAIVGLAPTDDDAETAMSRQADVAERTDPEAAARRAEERAAANVQAVMAAVDKMREMSAQWSDDARTATDEICDRLMNGDIDIPDARTEFGAVVRRNRS